MLVYRGTILLTIYACKGGMVVKRLHDDKGEGVWILPKNDDVIYEQPLIESRTFAGAYLSAEKFKV